MAEISRFFDLTSYTESDQAEVQNRFRSSGVIGGVTNGLVVGAPGGLFISVDAGEAFVEGFWYKNTAPINLPVNNNTSGSTRIDYVVLHLDRVDNQIYADVKLGTPGSGVPPTLTQVAGGSWEIALATITVPTGTTSAITAGMIGDVRSYSKTVKNAQDVGDNTVGYAGLIDGAVSNSLLSYKAITDLFNGTSIPVTTYVGLVSAQNFTVSTGARFLLVCLQIASYAIAGSAFEVGIHILINGTTRYLVGGDGGPAAGASPSCSGTIIIPAPAAGVSNITPQIYATTALNNFYLRAAGNPGVEGLAMQVLEIRR